MARPSEPLVAGWGRTPRSRPRARHRLEPGLDADFAQVGRRGLTVRGLGRSYGDAAQNAGGTVLDLHSPSDAAWYDETNGVALLDGGLSLESLHAWTLPQGWFAPVVPGTCHVTMGGAFAADVHGKNHHHDGSFAEHVDWIELESPVRGVVRLNPDDDLFWATAGGMGLTGIIRRLALSLRRVETAYLRVTTNRMASLDEVLDGLVAADQHATYSVAWLDLFGTGRGLGRGILNTAEHAELADLSRRQTRAPLDHSPGLRLALPDVVPSGLLMPTMMRAFNTLWWRRAPRDDQSVESATSFFHPLDAITNWNRLYGRRGFLQHQFVIPSTEVGLLRHIIERLANSGTAGFLAVLKRFGPASRGHLSFPGEGWTLAVDFPAKPGLAGLLDEIDDLIAGVGGRIYLAKDSRLDPKHVPTMYPRLEAWRELRRGVDPEGLLTSDLNRRLGLTGPKGRSPRIAPRQP